MRDVLRTLVVLVAAVASPPVATALDIPYQFDPNRHNRFLSGFGSTPVQNPNVLGMPALDFSGVGWGSGSQAQINVAMVTPRHFIVAEHFRPSVGSSINFLGTDGVVRSYTVQNYLPLKYDEGNPANVSDLMIGQLVQTIQPTDNISIYSVVRPGPFAYPLENTPPEYLDYYRGREIVVVGRNDPGGTDVDGDGFDDRGGKISKNVIDDVGVYQFGDDANTRTVGVGFESPLNTPDVGRFVSGDSGSPTFLLYNGQLTALGSHSGADFNSTPQYNVDGFLPYYVDQINALISSTGFQINVLTPVPEPAAYILVGAAGALVVCRSGRRKRAA
jgi:hypothetical protein